MWPKYVMYVVEKLHFLSFKFIPEELNVCEISSTSWKLYETSFANIITTWRYTRDYFLLYLLRRMYSIRWNVSSVFIILAEIMFYLNIPAWQVKFVISFPFLSMGIFQYPQYPSRFEMIFAPRGSLKIHVSLPYYTFPLP